MMAVLRWYVIYRDTPQKEFCTEERAARVAVLKRFEGAKPLSMHNGRAVVAMWLTDAMAGEPEAVIEVHGRVPPQIEALHQAYLREKEKPRR